MLVPPTLSGMARMSQAVLRYISEDLGRFVLPEQWMANGYRLQLATALFGLLAKTVAMHVRALGLEDFYMYTYCYYKIEKIQNLWKLNFNLLNSPKLKQCFGSICSFSCDAAAIRSNSSDNELVLYMH